MSARWKQWVLNPNHKAVLSFSGGKDSTAMYLLAMEQGIDFLPVFADTGHEQEYTYDYVYNLPRLTGGPEIKWVRADFSEQFARKRMFIARDARTGRKNGRKVRWTNKAKRRALSVLHPSGIPFLDLCMLKGRFPSTKARFCSEELKHHPIFFDVLDPLMEAGETVISWQGVRAEESEARSNLPRLEKVGGGLFNYRPIHHWTWQQVFDIHRRHNVEPNPLYKHGCSRVGCMLCIHARKSEIQAVSKYFPGEIDRMEEWERLVSMVAKRQQSTFFAADKTPGAHQTNRNMPMPDIRQVVEWSGTSRGGRQFDLFIMAEPPKCSSLYGLCG